ncbi:hypothetical protein BG011_005892 [Mortierella polycephala]|uniref:Uncharacterized protein n=1 Tax=Mortierella polycephala TaxID=41804 RepID=A0A9P6U0B4_9FUNG|nr:hypothetical protein BG011_005892 [Mortierella polycephala]
MASSIRAVTKGLPRVSMARIPIVAFASSHANSVHPNAYSSMSPRTASKDSETAWAASAKDAAHRLEHSAQKLATHTNQDKEDYIRDVKPYDTPEDEVMMELGLAMSNARKQDARHTNNVDSTTVKSAGPMQHNHSGGKLDVPIVDSTTFEDSLVDEIQADVVDPSENLAHGSRNHEKEMIHSLSNEVKDNAATLSQHASDAIRMVESHSVLKQDSATIHNVGDEDPASKTMDSQKRK